MGSFVLFYPCPEPRFLGAEGPVLLPAETLRVVGTVPLVLFVRPGQRPEDDPLSGTPHGPRLYGGRCFLTGRGILVNGGWRIE
jgi:hypothetical protein